MKRPEFIESLKTRASLSNRVSIGGNNALILVHYVEVLEKALDGRVRNSDPSQHVVSQTAAYLEIAERELEDQP